MLLFIYEVLSRIYFHIVLAIMIVNNADLGIRQLKVNAQVKTNTGEVTGDEDSELVCLIEGFNNVDCY